MLTLIKYLLLVVVGLINPPSPRYVGPAKWHGGSNNKPINRIVIHATVGAEPGTAKAAESTVAYSNNTPRPSSYHYIADALHSLQYVLDGIVAYGAPPNEHSIHYECCCSLSNSGKGHWALQSHQQMLRIVAKDVARLCLAYNVPIVKLGYLALRAGKRGIAGHNDVRLAWNQTTHTDPGPYFPWKQFIRLVQAEADVLVAPPEKKLSRGAGVERAILELQEAASKSGKHPVRLRKIKSALDSLRSIHAH